MYSKKFCKMYDEYGWDYFSTTMGEAILKYFEANKKSIYNHLDLACGTGALCNFFYYNKIKSQGIDISKDMIGIAKNKNDKINFTVEDMTDYKLNKKFDLITITCDAVNHVLEEFKIDTMFFNIHEMLNKDGYLIFDILNKDTLVLNTDIISNRGNGVIVKYFVTEKNNLINTNIKIEIDNNLVFEYNVLEKLYDIDYIKSILHKYKFNIVKIDDKILNENQRVKDKLYIICRK